MEKLLINPTISVLENDNLINVNIKFDQEGLAKAIHEFISLYNEYNNSSYEEILNSFVHWQIDFVKTNLNFTESYANKIFYHIFVEEFETIKKENFQINFTILTVDNSLVEKLINKVNLTKQFISNPFNAKNFNIEIDNFLEKLSAELISRKTIINDKIIKNVNENFDDEFAQIKKKSKNITDWFNNIYKYFVIKIFFFKFISNDNYIKFANQILNDPKYIKFLSDLSMLNFSGFLAPILENKENGTLTAIIYLLNQKGFFSL